MKRDAPLADIASATLGVKCYAPTRKYGPWRLVREKNLLPNFQTTRLIFILTLDETSPTCLLKRDALPACVASATLGVKCYTPTRNLVNEGQ
ncbi:MAG: hypothetical protein AAF388_11120 [Bacteroidota bacterium]